MITIKFIPNILSRDGRKVCELEYSRSKTLEDYIQDSGFDIEGMRIIVSGKCVYGAKESADDLSIILEDGDEVSITPSVEVTGAIAIIGAVVSAVSAGAAAVTGAMAAIGAITVFGVTLSTIGSWVMTIGTILSLGMGIYSFFTKPKTPSFGSSGTGIDENSPTYGWDGVQTQMSVGVPVAVVYGEHKIGGNIINSYIWEDGDKSYLNLLIGLCEGEIESITDIKINDNPESNFTGIDKYERYGANTQSVIPNFSDINRYSSPMSVSLTKNNSYTYTTTNNDVEGFELHLSFPAGIFLTDKDTGDIKSWSVSYKVEYKLHTETLWTDLGITTVSKKSRTKVKRIFRKDGLSSAQYDIRITRTSDDSDFYHTGNLILTYVNEIATDDLAYPNTALLGLKMLATDQLSGATPNVTCIVKGRKVLSPAVTQSGVSVSWEDYYWDSVSEKYKLFSDDSECEWDGSYEYRYSANPVWAMYDLLVNNRFGLGEYIKTDNVNLNNFLEMSKYCDEKVSDGSGGYEKRFRLDVVIDGSNKALDIIYQLASTFRCLTIYSGGRIHLRIDKADTPVQLFGMGNIIAGSYTENWKGVKDIPNIVEVQFMDKDLDYRQETVAIADEEALASGQPLRKKQLRLFCTHVSQAIREGRYALWFAKYVNRTITFKAGIDAITAQAGDLISVSHDVPQIGFSGRVQIGSTADLIKLDRTVTIEDSKTYKLRIRFSDDTSEERTVTNSAGEYSELTVDAFSQIPNEYDVYAFGESEKVKKDYRILAITRESKGEVAITALEYNESVYDESGIVLPTNNASALDSQVPAVEDLILTERTVKKADGTIDEAIDVWWTLPERYSYQLESYVKAKVFIKETNSTSWILAGETTGDSFTIANNILVGSSYDITVVSVGEHSERSIIDSPQDTITINGKGERPDDVKGFTVGQDGNEILMTWSANTDTDLKGYEIREGDVWERGVIVAQNLSGTLFRIPVFGYGEKRYMIKAMDTSGNYSLNAQYSVIEISGTISFDNVQEDDLLDFENGEWRFVSDKNAIIIKTSSGEEIVNSLDDDVIVNTYGFEKRKDILDVVDSSGEQVITSGGDNIFAYSDYSYLSLREFDGVYVREGTFITDVIDLGSRLRVRLNIVVNVEAVNATAVLYISVSDDNVNWSDWTEYSYGEYVCRYYKIKLVVTNNVTNSGAKVSALSGYATIQYYEEEWADEEVVETKSIVFRKTYYSKVAIAALAHGAKYVRVSDKTLQGCTLEVRDDATGALTSGTVDIKIKGY